MIPGFWEVLLNRLIIVFATNGYDISQDGRMKLKYYILKR